MDRAFVSARLRTSIIPRLLAASTIAPPSNLLSEGSALEERLLMAKSLAGDLVANTKRNRDELNSFKSKTLMTITSLINREASRMRGQFNDEDLKRLDSSFSDMLSNCRQYTNRIGFLGMFVRRIVDDTEGIIHAHQASKVDQFLVHKCSLFQCFLRYTTRREDSIKASLVFMIV